GRTRPSGLGHRWDGTCSHTFCSFLPSGRSLFLPFLSLRRENPFRPTRGDVYSLRHERPQVVLPVDINPRKRGGRRERPGRRVVRTPRIPHGPGAIPVPPSKNPTTKRRLRASSPRVSLPTTRRRVLWRQLLVGVTVAVSHSSPSPGSWPWP